MAAHVTIVGSGVAAAAASLEALAQGAEVTVIGGRSGGSSMGPGVWDVAAPPFRRPHDLWEEIPGPTTSLEEVIRRSPRHPYSILSQDGSRNLVAILSNSFERLSNRLSLHLKGSLGQPFLALTPLGTVKTTAFADPAHAAGNLREFREARLLIVGFTNLPPFSPELCRDQLKGIHQRQKFPYCAEIRSARLELKGIPDPVSPIDFAKRLDEEELIEELYDRLVGEASRHRATHVALPPVIGLHQNNHIFSRLAETTSVHWFEVLGIPPSVPGLRLYLQLMRFYRGERLTLREGLAQKGKVEGHRLSSLRVDGQELAVDRVVLATGKFLGGGITHANNRFCETLLDLPLFSGGQVVNSLAPCQLTSRDFFDSQGLGEIGVRTGPRLQPVDERGQLLYENVWVAGSLLSGYDAALEGCGMGVALATGTVAGREASL